MIKKFLFLIFINLNLSAIQQDEKVIHDLFALDLRQLSQEYKQFDIVINNLKFIINRFDQILFFPNTLIRNQWHSEPYSLMYLSFFYEPPLSSISTLFCRIEVHQSKKYIIKKNPENYYDYIEQDLTPEDFQVL